MDIVRAKEIVATLAEGIDPITGEVLASDHVCNNAEVVRAFYTVLAQVDVVPKKNYPENAGKPWTKEEEGLLLNFHAQGMTMKEIGKRMNRSSGSISSRLKKMGIKR